MSTFNPVQYEDLRFKSQDLYAQAKYDILLDYLVGHDGLRILVAGCGSGELCLRLAELGHKVIGIDPEPKYVRLALRHRGPGRSRCRFEVSSIEQYAGAGDFDCVVSTDVLEHIADDHTAFAKMASLVRPGGLVLITVPAGPWLFGYHDEQLGHYRRYTAQTLRKLVSSSCRVEKIRYFGFGLIPVCLLFSRWMRRPYPVAQAGDSTRRPVSAWLLRQLLRLERRVPMPLGTSVVLKAVRQAAPARPLAA